MSPSQSIVDIEKDQILFDEVLSCFRATLEGLCKPFALPGNSFVFEPTIYLTVIVNTPFFVSPAQQVLIQGVEVSMCNIMRTVELVKSKFHFLEGRIAHVSALAHDKMEAQRVKSGPTILTIMVRHF